MAASTRHSGAGPLWALLLLWVVAAGLPVTSAGACGPALQQASPYSSEQKPLLGLQALLAAGRDSAALSCQRSHYLLRRSRRAAHWHIAGGSCSPNSTERTSKRAASRRRPVQARNWQQTLRRTPSRRCYQATAQATSSIGALARLASGKQFPPPHRAQYCERATTTELALQWRTGGGPHAACVVSCRSIVGCHGCDVLVEQLASITSKVDW